ncbi:MAG: hypothetical protein PHH31_09505 [Acidaminococcaceae bacterium]|nr:hypothetical protein [Acidaminococcaceae bacterium]
MKKLNGYFKQIKNGSLKGEFGIVWKFFYNNLLAYILLYLQNVLINRYMPLESLGQFSYGQSMMILFSSVYSMEVYSAYLRFIGCNNEKELVGIVRKVLFIASALFSVTVLIYFRLPLYILFFGYMWMRERLYFFRAKMDISTYGRIKIFQYLLSIFILFILIIFNGLNEKSMLVGISISYLAVSLVYNFNDKAKKIIKLEDDLPAVETKEIIRYALPLSFNAIVVWLLGAADQMLIDRYLDAMTLTYYSVGFRIINVIRIGTGVIMEYWPRFYFERMGRRDYSAVKIMHIIFMGVVAALCVGTIVFSKPLYWLMGASQYSDMRWMFSMLAAAELFRQWGSINITFQSYMKNTSINVLCLSVLGGIKLIINWMFIKEAGVSILFHTTLGCYFLYYMCSLYFGSWKERQYMKQNP